MRAVIQRVEYAAVEVNGRTAGKIDRGFLIFLGVGRGDGEEQARRLAAKIIKMRIFKDAEGKINLSLSQTGGSVLVVSQFTLYANCVHGNRPDFLASAPPDEAQRLYEYFTALLRAEIPSVQTGIFGAEMRVSLLNDGPFTVILDTDELK